MNWEYYTIEIPANINPDSTLNAFGQKSWELVTTYKNGKDINSWFVFKRPI